MNECTFTDGYTFGLAIACLFMCVTLALVVASRIFRP